ncbi:MAG TPA: PAS domain S-box protein [Candidatus Dormibacteraeota bacterium]|nr:PAS domain S-box protein [Candidatus Dormibacteraeota bacterium]
MSDPADMRVATELSVAVTDVLEAMPDGIVVSDLDGHIVFVNGQTEALSGYTRQELIGQPVDMLVPTERQPLHRRHRAAYQAMPVSRSMGAELDIRFRRKDGTEFPADIALSPMSAATGRIIVAVVRDATERREQERRLRRQRDEILELSTPVIQVWDKVLVLPIIGTLDSARAARLTESLLTQIAEHQAEVVILDISGVPTIDTQVAQHLLRTVQAAQLMGAVSILCGVRPETAQAIVHLGIDLGQLRSRTTLRDALQLAIQVVRERAGVGPRDEGVAGGAR